MPAYNYKCSECDLIFEVIHKMNESPQIKCQECGLICQKTLEGVNITTYTRGYGYCDKSGCKRDMDLYKLQKDDPYKRHRTSGEADYIASNLRKGGKHQKNTKTFAMGINKNKSKKSK